MTRRPLLAVLFAALFATACGGSPSESGATTPPVVGVEVTPSAVNVPVGGSETFAAAVTGTTSRAVTWSIQEGSACGSVSSAGVYSAPGVASTCHVVATSAADTTKSGSATVTVTPAPVLTVNVSPASPSVAAGGTVAFAATVSGAVPGQPTTVTWSVPAGAGSIGASTGVYVAPSTPGTYVVTATSVAAPTTFGTATVTVVGVVQPPDTTPPTVSLTAPTEGQSVSGTVTVTATASDNVAVTSVRLLLDGAQFCAPSTTPFACAWNTTAAVNGAHTLTAVAQDAAGNSTTSAARHVTVANAATGFLRVSTTGVDSGNCKASPCRTIVYGISKMLGGDTLVVGNGVYPEANAIRNVPSGNAGPDGVPGTADDVYTTVMAETDFGVLIDGSGWPDTWVYGIRIENASYVKVQGFRVHGRQSNGTGGPMTVLSSHHVKIIRCGFAYGGVSDNTATVDLGPDNDYVLVEECYAFGGGRYQYVVYWSDHTVIRRSVARNDYWRGSLQSAAFTNYDSIRTVWQNNIAIDSDESCCSGHLYAGFFNENKTDHANDTSQAFLGNIVLNYGAFYAAHLDWVVSGTRVLTDNIYWDSMGGYWGDQGPGVTASWTAKNLTSGAAKGLYDGPNMGPGLGTGLSIYGNLTNQVRDSIFAGNRSFGVADYVSGDYNAFSGNGANYGGQHTPTPGAHDVTSVAIVPGVLKYLPRGPEAGSLLATAGSSGGRVGAQVLWKIGVDGTLWGEPGYDTLRDAAHGFGGVPDRLWPFPNEAAIKLDMAAYNGGGLAGRRGFCSAGKQLDGTSNVTLTSYIWEYLGNPMPASIY